MLVSFLMPTRRRAQLACESIDSLRTTATDPACFEICLAIDQDDLEAGMTVVDHCIRHGIAYQAWFTPRLGYDHLHIYDNTLATIARGAWLFIWNDDVRMDTPGWDTELASYNAKALWIGDPRLSNAKLEDFARGLFPIVPRQWFCLLGHLSVSPHVDSYIFWTVRILERVFAEHLAEHDDQYLAFQPNFTLHHARFNETGENNDETYREGQAAYKTEDFWSHYPERKKPWVMKESIAEAISRDVERILRAAGRSELVDHLIALRVPV